MSRPKMLRRAGTIPVVVWTLAVVDLLGFGALQVLAGEASQVPWWLVAELLLITALFGGVGALIVTRKARNTVGWLMLLLATLVAANLSSLAYTTLSVANYAGKLPGTMAAGWFASWTFAPGLVAALLFLPLLFPDGRLPGRRWRWVAAMFGLITVLAALPDLLRPGPFFGGSGVPGASALPDNPTGVPGAGGFLDAVSQLNGVLTFLASLLAVAAMIQRYRRGILVERQQLKWFGASVVVAMAGLIVATVLPSIGEAVLRYRLYEIDRIVSRTLAYAVLTAILAGVYIAGFLGLQAILAPFITNGGSIAVAASTLVVFALFQPIRRRIQGIVDRRFNRGRYDAAREIHGFASRVRDEVEVDRLAVALATTLERTMQPASTSIWIRDR